MSVESDSRFHEGNFEYVLLQMLGEVEDVDVRALRNKLRDDTEKSIFDRFSSDDQKRFVLFDRLTNSELRFLSNLKEANYPVGLHGLKTKVYG